MRAASVTVLVMGPTCERLGASRLHGNATEGGLVAHDPREGGGYPNGAAAVGADGQRPEPSRHRRTSAAARSTGRAIQVPGVARDAEEQVVGGADPAESGRVGLAELDGACREHPLHDGGGFRGYVVRI